MPLPQRLTQHEIVVLISRLVGRPARTDHRLPLIWLSSLEQGERVLDALFGLLESSARYLVPHARVAATSDPPREIRALLLDLCAQLSVPRFGGSGKRLRFQHFELADFLMELKVADWKTENSSSRGIATRLRERYGPSQGRDDGRGGNQIDLGPKYRMVIWLVLRVVPEVLFRAAIRGKIPGFGHRYRWFMRQQYLAPLQSVDFLGFAERLAEGVRERENADQINSLLVHAFLEDLRRAYRRRPGRIEGWRRTAYPVVLIDNVARGSDGYRLLQLVNGVRNETGQSDPLLVVCSSDEVPQAPAQETPLPGAELDSDHRREVDPVYRDPAYVRWVDALPGSRRARVGTAWYLPISVADSGGSASSVPGITARRPPRWARRSVVATALGLPVLLGVGWVLWQYGGGRDCSHIPFGGQVDVRGIDGECIGYSGSRHFRFNDAPGQEALLHIQDTIFAQNDAASKLWESNRSRPYVTVVYFGIFTGRPVGPNEEAYAAEREELEGLALAQYDSVVDQPATAKVPLLRIVIANGGQRMRRASAVADMIGRLAAEDPAVVAVIGLDESRENTASALKKFNEIGLPVISTTLSADHMDKNSQFYLQLGAPNRETAQTIAAYSQRALKVPGARVYWTTGESNLDNDLYVRTLVGDLNGALRQSGITVDYSGQYVHGSLPGDVCSYLGVMIFAGRWDDFPDFFDAFNGCPDGRSLHVIADDSISRYMENPALRKTAPATLPLIYASKTVLITCEYLRSAHENSSAQFLRLIQEAGFVQSFQGAGPLHFERCGQGGQDAGVIGERVPSAYDAAMLVRRAVEDLGNEPRPDPSRTEWNPRSIVPASVYLKIRQETHKTPFFGVTGAIMFTDDGDDVGEPVGRGIHLLQVHSVPDVTVQPVEVFSCNWNNRDNAQGSACR